MASDPEHPNDDLQGEDWTPEEQTDLMSRYERIAEESHAAPSKDGQSVVADYGLGGSVPRTEQSRGRYKAKDIYIRLENTIYGPITQDELAEMLGGGELTGFESASADLQHWTPLIYHPRMTLNGEIDPDATHDMLHQHSTLPTASRAVDKFDLEALGEADDVEDILPSTPLAAILIKPMRVSRKTGLALPVHADLKEESLENVIERTEIPAGHRVSGEQALAAIANRAQELAARGDISFSDEFDAVEETDPSNTIPALESLRADAASEDIGFDDLDLDVDVELTPDHTIGVDSASQPMPFGDDYGTAAPTPEEVKNIDLFSPTAPMAIPPSDPASSFVSWLVVLLVLAAAAVAAMTTLKTTTPTGDEALQQVIENEAPVAPPVPEEPEPEVPEIPAPRGAAAQPSAVPAAAGSGAGQP